VRFSVSRKEIDVGTLNKEVSGVHRRSAARLARVRLEFQGAVRILVGRDI
jgi:hypothetical protein